jgi:WD40 repeat protein
MKYASRRMLLALVIWCCAMPTGARSQTSQTREAPLQAGHTHDIIEIKWSPDDQRLVSYSGGDGHVRLWDVRTGRLLWSAATSFIQRKDEHYSLMAFAWSRDRSLIASGSGNGRVQVWDAQTGKLRWMADAHAENVNVIAFSPDGKYIISSGLNDADQDEIRLWRAADGSPVRMFKSKVGVVIAASFAADGRTVKTGSIDGEVWLWAVGTGRRIRARRLNACADASRFARGVAFSPDLSVMAARCGDQTVVTGASDGQVTRRVAMSVDFTETLAFSGDGRVLAANDSGEFRVFGLPRGAIKQVDEFNLGHTVDLNHDGSLLAEGGGWGEAAIKITEIATGKTYRLLEGHPGIVRALAFSPDGETLASGGGDRIARIWDARGGKLLKSLSGHTKPINAVAFSPDGSTLVTCARDETLRVWDATSGRLLHTIESKDDGIWGIEAMVFSPDGSTLLTTGQRTHFKLWDAIHWRVVRTFQTREEHRSGNTSYCCGSRALSVSFSPDGRQILSGHEDGTIKIWDMNGAQPLRVIESKTRDARGLQPRRQFNPERRRRRTGGEAVGRAKREVNEDTVGQEHSRSELQPGRQNFCHFRLRRRSAPVGRAGRDAAARV